MSDEHEVRLLYEELVGCWNRRDAAGLARLFAEDGTLVGFDGSTHDGRAQIASDLSAIFTHHRTPACVGSVRRVRFPAAGVAVLGAVAGMVPAGRADFDPALNAVQTLVAARLDGRWRIALFHNTPAAFHGRPELAEQLTAELRQVLQARRPDG